MAETKYEDLTVPELQSEVDRLGLTITGTGADGNVLKGDLVAALHAADASDPEDTSGRPSLDSVASDRATNRNVRVYAQEEN